MECFSMKKKIFVIFFVYRKAKEHNKILGLKSLNFEPSVLIDPSTLDSWLKM